ncbi:hypothetical protein PBV87_00035 [Niameybacter massiliensis]|uniref:Uncharacterized protein n=1 Tax=Holtiella tumoricola TaxID=3018743 RepID=A0AA42DJ61_9FIRM|nr:hypothetical protein [Holtiella tumoricola]MDA3729900.1 hypothetical protein [Holtiella tumoricola]
MSEKLKGLKRNAKSKLMLLMMSCCALSVSVFANTSTGDTNLDTMITKMTDGLTVMSKGGVLIIGAVIGFAITFIAARWLFGLFKQWSSKAN